jgi:16S rRNA (guanine527-N7)-methyltransferase
MSRFDGLRQAVQDTLGYQLSDAQLDSFAWYADELIKWNQRFNLTAIEEPVEIDIKHFLDSLTCLKVPSFRPPAKIIDVGTGAGFPGIPLKILFPQFDLTLVDSVEKKVRFCQHIVDHLGLQSVRVIHDRAERLGQDDKFRESYDWGLARAVAIAPVVLEYLIPLIRVGGGAILQKGETGPAEMQASEQVLNVLGATVEQILPIELPCVVEPRYLITLRKTSASPEKYPRRPGMPTKRPLDNP